MGNTNNRLSYLLFILALLVVAIAHSQKEPQYTQYMYNIGSFNPAYVGTVETAEINTMYRAQWLSIPGAPRTLRLGANLPFSNEKMGLGVNVINDQLGPLGQTYIDVAYSYQLNLSENTKLSFGLDVGGSLLDVDFSKGTFENPGEPILNGASVNEFYFTIGAGIFMYQDNWYLGMSVPNFLNDGLYDQQIATVVEDKMQYNVIGGFVFEFSETTKFKPAFLVNYIEGAPVNFNVSGNFLFNERFVIGAGYGLDNAVSGLTGFQITNAVFFGVSYDYNINGLGAYNDGTPEFVLKFYLGRRDQSSRSKGKNGGKGKPKQIDTPRFF